MGFFLLYDISGKYNWDSLGDLQDCHAGWSHKNRNTPEIIHIPSYKDDIFRTDNPSVWQIPMFSQIFHMRNMGRFQFSQCFKLNLSSISHQQAVAEY
jgi:hypothetical protein